MGFAVQFKVHKCALFVHEVAINVACNWYFFYYTVITITFIITTIIIPSPMGQRQTDERLLLKQIFQYIALMLK